MEHLTFSPKWSLDGSTKRWVVHNNTRTGYARQREVDMVLSTPARLYVSQHSRKVVVVLN
ncbi:hypothetical protein BDV59DRAFT_188976 [Aspergillus ambiguus]|uniref:uncharacterized protein n=1 Tax=Aspergillus ambiguus TaxID=176160 RepID=UPI003CCE3387